MNIDDLVARVESLERSARRWRRGCVGLALCCLVGVAAGAMKPNTVTATKFVLLDDKGKQRASLHTGDFGLASLDFNDPDDKSVVASIESFGDGYGRVFVSSKKGQAKVEMQVTHGGGENTLPEGHVEIVGSKGESRGMLGSKD